MDRSLEQERPEGVAGPGERPQTDANDAAAIHLGSLTGEAT